MIDSTELSFRGLQKTTLLDYPGHVACILFTGGCNFRCQYCYNCSLVNKAEPPVAWDAVWSLLERRRNVLDGVCISGGEPTLAPYLPEFLRKVKQQGYKVKLDTNGYQPTVLADLVKEELVDFIAMDIKNSPQKYAQTCGLPAMDLSRVKASAEIVQQSGLEYEFRTTVSTELMDEADLTAIVEHFGRGKRYSLKPVCRNLPTLSGRRFTPPFPDVLERWGKAMEAFYDEVMVHGV